MSSSFNKLKDSVFKFKSALSGYFGKLKDDLFSLKGAFVGLIGAMGVRSVFNTIASFEKMEASLRTVTGSAKGAADAMNLIQGFAASTPFQITELTDAFIKLQALGLDPSEAALKSYGNTASAMGKSLNQMIEAVADAATGEFERLKEFGIKASSQGDRVKFTFQGVTTEVGKNSKEIQDYLLAIGDTRFAGAMEQQMDTLSGLVSNFQDQLDMTIVRLGRAGLTDVFKALMQAALTGITFVGEQVARLPLYFQAAFGTIHKGIVSIKMAFAVMGEAIAFTWEKSLATVQENFGIFMRGIASAIDRIPGLGDQGASLDAYGASLETAANNIGTLSARIDPLIAQYQREKDAIDGVVDAAFQMQLAKEAAASVPAVPTVVPTAGATGGAGQAVDPLDRLLDEAALQEMLLAQQSDYNEKKLQQQRDYWDQLYNLETGSQEAALAFSDAIRTQDVKGALAHGASMLSTVSRTNKTAFEMQKRLALANAAVTLPSAVVKSYENAGGYPLGIIPAGLMLAAGLQQINAIRSASFQGGGGTPPAVNAAGKGGAVGTAAGLPPGAATPLATQQAPEKTPSTFKVEILGNVIGNEQFVNDVLIPGIKDAVENRDEVLITSGSRNATELQA